MDGLVLLTSPKGKETATRYLDDLEAYTGKITLSVSGTTETSNEYFVILIDEGHATIPRYVGSDSLVVFLELDSHTLSDGGVGLLGFDGDFLNNDSGSVGGASEWLLPLRDTVGFFVTEIGPALRVK